MTGRSQSAFVLRVEDELRRRRERELERCVGCGKAIRRSADYTRVRGGLMHVSCSETQPAVAVAS